MLNQCLIARSSRLTSFVLCAVLCCIVPFLVDVTLCDAFAAPPLLQPALEDGETLDPSKSIDDSFSPVCQCICQVWLPVDPHNGEPILVDSRRPLQGSHVVILTSRPPPFV